jgi:hypothetical protein
MLKVLRLFAGIPWTAPAVLALIFALMASAGPVRHQTGFPQSSFTDIALYRAITTHVQAGEHYYDVAALEQRAHGYPIRPAVTIREPTEAWLLAALETDPLRRAAIITLALFSVTAMHLALRRDAIGPVTRIVGTLSVMSSLVFLLNPVAPYLHEVWAGFLITASIAAWRPERYVAAVVLALFACLFREIAAPVLLVMGAFAIAEKKWQEVTAWCVAIGVFGMLVMLHLWLASREALPTDGVSPGWLAVGGWNFILATAQKNVVLSLLPSACLSAVVAVSLIGLAAANSHWERRLGAVVLAFIGLFCVVGQPYNSYWGFLYAPLLPIGLAFALRLLLQVAIAIITACRIDDGRACKAEQPVPGHTLVVSDASRES